MNFNLNDDTRFNILQSIQNRLKNTIPTNNNQNGQPIAETPIINQPDIPAMQAHQHDYIVDTSIPYIENLRKKDKSTPAQAKEITDYMEKQLADYIPIAPAIEKLVKESGVPVPKFKSPAYKGLVYRKKDFEYAQEAYKDKFKSITSVEEAKKKGIDELNNRTLFENTSYDNKVKLENIRFDNEKKLKAYESTMPPSTSQLLKINQDQDGVYKDLISKAEKSLLEVAGKPEQEKPYRDNIDIFTNLRQKLADKTTNILEEYEKNMGKNKNQTSNKPNVETKKVMHKKGDIISKGGKSYRILEDGDNPSVEEVK